MSLFYLAAAVLFSTICEQLHEDQCLTGPCRIVLEKPIGESLATSQVNETLARFFNERDIYRIDHYEETVQNLLVLRFANRFINSQWDQSCIDHVQITVAEQVGIEGRWTSRRRWSAARYGAEPLDAVALPGGDGTATRWKLVSETRRSKL